MDDLGFFHGFSEDALHFLSDLKANNTRDWFAAHKKTYEAEVKKPAKAFCSAMTQALHAHTGTLHTAKVFRINRDIRFTKDKTPYNAHLHILFRKEGSPTALFFGLQPDNLVLGAGLFKFEGDQLNAYRQAVAGPRGPALQEILDAFLAEGARLNAPPLKRVPSGFDKDHPRAELLKRKGLALWLDQGPRRAMEETMVEQTLASYAWFAPLNDWLEQSL
ncbi:MAG: DUF2461 domain-containing protein [Pseudomonadota bacterium]